MKLEAFNIIECRIYVENTVVELTYQSEMRTNIGRLILPYNQSRGSVNSHLFVDFRLLC
jgi:hypothetical protein